MKKGGHGRLINGIGDAALSAKTGRDWGEWLAMLDAAGARRMSHQQIVAHLREKCAVGAWWGQMITVGYEQERGLREKHQKPDGFEVSVSRTIDVPLPVLFRAWEDEALRGSWFPRRKFAIRRVTPEKSMRLAWGDGKSSVEVAFSARGAARSHVTCQHGKLARAEDVEKMRAFWTKALASLKTMLEAAG